VLDFALSFNLALKTSIMSCASQILSAHDDDMSAIKIGLPEAVHQKAQELARQKAMPLERLMLVLPISGEDFAQKSPRRHALDAIRLAKVQQVAVVAHQILRLPGDCLCEDRIVLGIPHGSREGQIIDKHRAPVQPFGPVSPIDIAKAPRLLSGYALHRCGPFAG
jgi:hypothetical protein